jgi:hypothetical protein
MSKDLSREKRIYLAIWRKAWREQVETLTVTMPNESLALTVRMSMYRTIKPYRQGDLFDDELRMAAEKYVLVVQKSPPAIILTHRKSADAAELAFSDLGLDEMDLMTAEEIASMNSAIKVSENLGSDHQVNPFYTREED